MWEPLHSFYRIDKTGKCLQRTSHLFNLDRLPSGWGKETNNDLDHSGKLGYFNILNLTLGSGARINIYCLLGPLGPDLSHQNEHDSSSMSFIPGSQPQGSNFGLFLYCLDICLLVNSTLFCSMDSKVSKATSCCLLCKGFKTDPQSQLFLACR